MKDLLPNKIYGASYDKPFKKVFSDKNTFTLFMKDVFDETIIEFHYIDKELSKDNKNRTYGICDMKIETKDKILIIEMQNHKKGSNKKWASIFNVNKKHLIKLRKELKYKKAVENIKEYNLDEKEYSVLRGERKMWTKEDEARIDWLCGYDEGDKNGERRGISIGEERGEKRGILTGKLETAQNLIKKGIDLSIVLEVTGLKENQILNSNKSSRITEKC